MRPADLERPRAILFDWDNTLVDTWPTIIECYRATFAALGHPPWTDQEVRDRAHGSLRDHFPVLFGAEADRAEEVFYETFHRIHLEKLQPPVGRARRGAERQSACAGPRPWSTCWRRPSQAFSD